ncbi:probable serine/threonine-protein kinase at1g18390 [Phtheirospermum japonicum]|uniref:Probable serine/threonine-protein kinase at1g18390 n=1 Tax=Phtheirospermum japonicum TaxID=374723 RepID=A0A830BKY7_9LAMI|nr:probable serine/threonine-protein kinase at1g18390 [Phtheirospermum japonicum]
MSIRPYNLFSCSSSGLNFTDAYYLLGPVPSDPILRIVYCGANINLPMLMGAGNRLAALQISLGEALREGFIVNYSVPNGGLCPQCNALSGDCGFDSVLGQPICICDDDRPCPIPLTPPPETSTADAPAHFVERSHSTTGRDIGLSVAGAFLACVGLGWLIFYCRERRERTIPSHPSSKSDLGRGSSYFGTQVFNCTELEEATNNFDPSRELGDGGFDLLNTKNLN